MINKISFEVETITPMFLSGADQKEVELRAQSIRGQLRYWYRALLGGSGVTDIGELKKMESDLWGKEEKGSKIAIILKDSECEKKDINTLRLGGGNLGMTYMLFSAKMNKRPYIQVGKSFKVELSTLDKKRSDEILTLSSIAFWAMAMFGGLGTRSRRCSGSIIIKNALGDAIPEELLPATIESCSDLKENIEKGLKKVKTVVTSICPSNTKSSSAGLPPFHILTSNATSIWLTSETWDTWEKAIGTIGTRYSEARKRIPLSNRRILGLPLILQRIL
ncbi:MAG: type III-B CRISPR module RAMP protein Cmr1 [Nitrospirota bacterium]